LIDAEKTGCAVFSFHGVVVLSCVQSCVQSVVQFVQCVAFKPSGRRSIDPVQLISFYSSHKKNQDD